MEQSDATQSLAGNAPLVMVVDDSDNDLALFRRAVQQLNYSGRIQYIEGGSRAIDYLAGTGEFGDRNQFPRPDFLILDLKMPGTSGFDVLVWMHDHEIPPVQTVVLSSSDDLREITRAYALGAASFVTKAINFTEFRETVGALLVHFGIYHTHPPNADAWPFAQLVGSTLQRSLLNDLPSN